MSDCHPPNVATVAGLVHTVLSFLSVFSFSIQYICLTHTHGFLQRNVISVVQCKSSGYICMDILHIEFIDTHIWLDSMSNEILSVIYSPFVELPKISYTIKMTNVEVVL